MVVVLAWMGFAQANVIWHLDNVTFDRPGFGTNTATGYFEVNSTVTDALVDWDIVVSGTNTAADHHYVNGGANEGSTLASSTLIWFYNWTAGTYLILDLASALTNAGGTINLVSDGGNGTIACPGCGVLQTGSITTSLPEPATLALLGLGLAGLGFARRKLN